MPRCLAAGHSLQQCCCPHIPGSSGHTQGGRRLIAQKALGAAAALDASRLFWEWELASLPRCCHPVSSIGERKRGERHWEDSKPRAHRDQLCPILGPALVLAARQPRTPTETPSDAHPSPAPFGTSPADTISSLHPFIHSPIHPSTHPRILPALRAVAKVAASAAVYMERWQGNHRQTARPASAHVSRHHGWGMGYLHQHQHQHQHPTRLPRDPSPVALAAEDEQVRIMVRTPDPNKAQKGACTSKLRLARCPDGAEAARKGWPLATPRRDVYAS
ncbi:hypothetical protein CC78DRAFT_565592 [Lojkania enalia]|uniref:Uncharacterized protein n=1 Tax=Lojkania enalia TaxID=147567 RepID=A0A9P4N863_9PLEO|nr:hypothetical protein CC78DRAFT_565592 [Didymosphaeria enalia]